MRRSPILPVLAVTITLLALAGCIAEPDPPSPATRPQTPAPSEPPSRSPTPPATAAVTASPAPSPPAESPRPPSLGQFDRLTCGLDQTYPTAALDRPAGDELRLDPAAAALRDTITGPTATELGFPPRGWRIVASRPDRVTYVADAGGHWAVATVARDALGRWQFLEGGACQLMVALPRGVGFASWRLDPARLPGPRAQSVSLLGTELACASGKPPGARVRPPIVVETHDSVVIGLLVTYKGGDCPGNPEFRVQVPLSAALGARTLYDGSSFPPARRS
jgi:hypothetical protein